MGRFMFLSVPVLFVLVFFILFSIVITSLEEEEAGLCASRAFVCLFVRVRFCHFSLPLGVVGWLRFMIVHSLDFSINSLLLCNKIFRILLLHVTVFCHVFFLCRYLCFCFFFFFFYFIQTRVSTLVYVFHHGQGMQKSVLCHM